ncbi:hypothetical protein Moror_8525 [Moniliophthora roreri MCA 2997]|uniref:Uncharacterized protein n=2 Tax=Moniliophthora roreri TaxID=221103 RepID=V2WLM7_MONRO|nr:hypothetical protein Moror_8525 [Moniliophthora roreri MCA 2997]
MENLYGGNPAVDTSAVSNSQTPVDLGVLQHCEASARKETTNKTSDNVSSSSNSDNSSDKDYDNEEEEESRRPTTSHTPASHCNHMVDPQSPATVRSKSIVSKTPTPATPTLQHTAQRQSRCQTIGNQLAEALATANESSEKMA